MIPKLRFPEFSEVWKKTTLGELAIFHDSDRVPLESSVRKKRKGIYPYYGASGIIDYVDDYLFHGEYILLAEDGANIINRSTPIAFLADGKFWVNNHAHILRTTIKQSFVVHLLENQRYDKYNTGTAQPKLNRKVCESISLYSPQSDLEIDKISSLLDCIDHKINLLTKKKEALETYKKGLMQKIFSQELRFKREDGTDYPEWISVRLDDLFEIGSSKRILQEFWQEEGVPFYRTRELVSLHNRKPFNSPIFISRKTYEEVVNKYGKPKIGDILCAGVGSIGHFVKVDESFGDFYFKDGNVLIMSPREDISTDFFLFLLYSSQIQKKIHSQSSITTVATFTITDAKRLKVLIPESNEERLRIAELLECVTKRINLTEDQIANVSKLKKGLLQQMFV